jgi:hypothetical protein
MYGSIIIYGIVLAGTACYTASCVLKRKFHVLECVKIATERKTGDV